MNDSSTPTGFLPPEPASLAPFFPGYEIHHLIAVGGMGAVYSANQKSLDRTVAIKILPLELSDDAEFRSGFEAEAKAMARLNHPNLIGVFDFGEVNGMLYIVMEFVAGQSLHHSAYGQAIDPSEVIRLVTGICNGLAHAHENGILHRDIKPSNILLTLQAEPKIGDFGLARPVEHQTKEGDVIFGTPGYTAPEVVNAPETVDHRADLFSVGVLLHELLTGKLPADDTRPASVISGCDPRFDSIILRATHPQPAYRYSSAAEIASELQQITNTPKIAAAAKVAGGPQAKTDHPSPPRRTVTVVKSKSMNLKWVGPLIAIGIMAFCWYQFMNMLQTDDMIEDPAAKTEESRNSKNATESVVEGVNEATARSSGPAQQPPLANVPQGTSNTADVETKAQQEIFRQFQGVYQNQKNAYVFLFTVDAAGRVTGFSDHQDARSHFMLDGMINNRACSMKMRILHSSRPMIEGPALDVTCTLLPDLNIAMRFNNPNGNAEQPGGVILRVNDPNECLKILDQAASFVKTEEARSVISRLKAIYLSPEGLANSNGISSAQIAASKNDGTVYDATDLTALRGKIGETVKVRGTVVSFAVVAPPSTDCYLYFSEPSTNAVLLVVSAVWEPNRHNRLVEFIGKSLPIEGVIETTQRGTLCVRVKSLADLKIVEEGQANGTQASAASVANEKRLAPSGIPSDASFFNGKWYRIYEEKQTWKEARDQCKVLGGQLVVIPDEVTQNFVKSLASRRTVWLGAYDDGHEGDWRWVDGTKMNYRNFGKGYPDNWEDLEHWLLMNWKTEEGQWNDYRNLNVASGYICEWPDKAVDLTSAVRPQTLQNKAAPAPEDPIVAARNMAFQEFPALKDPNSKLARKVKELKEMKETLNPSYSKDPQWPYLLAKEANLILVQSAQAAKDRYANRFPAGAKSFNGKKYLVYEDDVTWNRARIRCNEVNGQLAVIPDEATQAFIRDLAQGRPLWLGATNERREGRWKWIDGTEMTFRAFDQNQPDNAGNGEHFLMSWSGGLWNDAPDKWANITGYICEWKDTPIPGGSNRTVNPDPPDTKTMSRTIDNAIDKMDATEKRQLGQLVSRSDILIFGQMTIRVFNKGLVIASEMGSSRVIILKETNPKQAPFGYIGGYYNQQERAKTFGSPIEGEFALFDERYRLHIFDKGIIVWRRSDSRLESAVFAQGSR